MKIYNYGEKKPEIHPDTWLADDVVVYGDVQIEENVVVFPGSVIRGDIASVVIKTGTVIQDGVLINPSAGNKTKIGENCLIGFGSIIHGAIIGDNCIIGARSLIMPGVKIKSECMIGAMSFVAKGMIPKGKVWVGIPAKEKRDITERDLQMWDIGKKTFREIGQKYKDSK
ncbi:MAG: gamma carbonic anhydrase family protein [Candidatus Helarchaeota archaeon]|nr:gamma carbonic anhydrase family protein [Candidatus Helarchaeota archaeon]